MRPIAAAFLAALILPPAAAAAEIPCDCDPGCAERSDPLAGMTYEDEEHRLWYEVRFWTGRCEGEIWLACWSGPSWYDVMARVLEKVEPAARPDFCGRLYDLGVAIGHEWARDNAIRRIHTADLDDWKDTLIDGSDPASDLAAVEALTAERLK